MGISSQAPNYRTNSYTHFQNHELSRGTLYNLSRADVNPYQWLRQPCEPNLAMAPDATTVAPDFRAARGRKYVQNALQICLADSSCEQLNWPGPRRAKSWESKRLSSRLGFAASYWIDYARVRALVERSNSRSFRRGRLKRPVDARLLGPCPGAGTGADKVADPLNSPLLNCVAEAIEDLRNDTCAF